MNTKMSDTLMNMCRTCMKKCSSTKKMNKSLSIYEVPTGCKNNMTIIQILQLLMPERKMKIEDNLPNSVCSTCVDKLIIIHEFIEMLRNTDNKINDILINESNIAVLSIKNENKINGLIKSEFHIEEMIIEDSENKIEKSDRQVIDYENETLHEDTNDKEEPSLDTYRDETENCLPKAIDAKTEFKIDDTMKHDVIKEIDKPNSSIDKTFKDIPNETEIKCQECEKVLDNIINYQEHLKTHKLKKSMKNKYSKKLDIPRKKRTDKKILHKCEHCEKEFNQLAPYKSHLRMHSAETPFLCVECGKGFKSISGLNTHMLRHKGEKTFQCPHCPKKFVCSSGLCSHMIIHSNKKPYVCNICGSAFHQAYELKHHNLYHEGIKKYKCEYCDKSFVTKDKQIRHMRTHTGEKPYRCKYCDRAFAQTSDCVKHLRQHLGDNVYQCELCPQRFPLLRDLRAHFNNHKDDDEETRQRNLEARLEEERILNIKLGLKES